ncbi:MAG: asparagine synthase (glutamine-hydrolyzing), partial [Acidobacteriota bacterium]
GRRGGSEVCGFAGLVSADPRAGRSARQGDDVEVMLSPLGHRGPDDTGLESFRGATLGHRRLAVIDLSSRGAQPMPLRCAGSGSSPAVWIVANGEIYNYIELRAQLQRRGHRFTSDSDTEVILHLYEERGLDCVCSLRGMFAFALWDEDRRRLLLVRDRMGQKPLYYHVEPDEIAFASEVKSLAALRRARGRPVEADPEALRSYLALKYVPGPGTAVRGVRKMPPAHMMVHENGRWSIRRYWSLPHLTDAPPPSRRGPWQEELVEQVRESVRIRLRSDVGVGVFLSGGIDSGIVASMAALASRETNRPLRTFTVGFDQADYDEMVPASRMARALGAEHHEIRLRPTPADITDDLPDLAWHLDQPFADSSALAVHRLAQEVRRHVTVALSGDGGDELFLGYDRYRAHRLADRIGPAASWVVGRVAGPLLALLPAPANRRNLKGRSQRFLGGCARSPRDRNDAWICCLDESIAGSVFTADFRAAVQGVDPLAALHRAYGPDGGHDPIEDIQRADLLVYLPDDILHKVDAATMRHSLEARAPLLDHKVVELAMRIPTSLKLGRDGRGKKILREAFGAFLPAPIRRGRKAGFGLPLDHWLRRDLAGYCRDVLLDGGTLARGILRRQGVEALLAEHRSGAANREDAIWSLVMLEHWFRVLVDTGRSRAHRISEVAAG